MEIRFYEQALDSDLTYAVVFAKVGNQWLLCRRGDREAWEFPNGPRASGESIYSTASRRLREETGITECQMEPVIAYGLFQEGRDPSFGGVFFADVWEVASPLPESKAAECRLMETLPALLTHPEIQSVLFQRVEAWLAEGNFHSVQDDIFELMM